VPNGSLVDMTMFTRAVVTKAAVNEVVRTGIAGKFSKYVEYAADPIVSSDVKMSPYSSTFDSLATTLLGEHMVKTIAWYDNGWGYAHRVVDLIEHLKQIDGGLK
jgi:glyceraldehyde 3-phosphate dehydrogenase